MSDVTSELVIAKYEDAIDKLEIYQASEPESTKRAEAGQKISEYRDRIIDAAWDDIVGRTAALNTLTTDLNAIIANASNVPSVSGAIASLKNIVTELGV